MVYPAGGTGELYMWRPACGGRFFLGSFRIFDGGPGVNWVRFVKSSFWLLAIGGWPDWNWVRFAYLRAHRSGGSPDFEIPGSKLDAAIGWTRFVTPPVFGVALSLTVRGIIPES